MGIITKEKWYSSFEEKSNRNAGVLMANHQFVIYGHVWGYPVDYENKGVPLHKLELWCKLANDL